MSRAATVLVLFALAAFEAQSQAALSINTKALPDGRVGVPYDEKLDAKGGRTPYVWSITAGSLPAGLTLAPATGAITGAPVSAGTSSFTVRVTDAAGGPVAAEVSSAPDLAGRLPGARSGRTGRRPASLPRRAR